MTDRGQGKAVRRRSNDELRKHVGDDAYRIVREKGTERAFSGKYWDCEKNGTYRCVSCSTPLFSSAMHPKYGHQSARSTAKNPSPVTRTPAAKRTSACGCS